MQYSDILPPNEKVIPTGGYVTFTCINRATNEDVQFQWLVNGTRVENLNLEDMIMTDDRNNFVGLILFMNITVDYNNTIVQCKVNFTSGDIILSDNATLLVQGEEYG